MTRVVRLTNWRDPIEEGYFPKLDNILANRVWPPRPANARLNVIQNTIYFINYKNVYMCKYTIFTFFLYFVICIQQNINREADQLSFDIEDLERWRDRIFNAIHSGFIVNVIIFILVYIII